MNHATNTATDVCPSEIDLRAFSLGNLPADNIDTIGLHIMHCSRCDTLVDAIEQDTDALIAQIRDWMRPVSFESECQLEQLESHARAIKLSDVGLPRIPETEIVPPRRDDESVSQNSAAISTATFGLSQHIPSNLVEELPGGIDRYEIQKKLGGGGFAHVYLAHDPELNRHVAIKVPRQDRLSEATAAQFLAEGQAAAVLSHPSIIKVFDWGRTPDGLCYVVMEYIEGQSLSDAIKSGAIDQTRAIQITIQVADALHYMHKNSLVHRDVKPANILLDANGNAHLSDFGLAVHDNDQWLHRDELAGTRPYMSPEQVQGKSHHLDGRTDIWSLGVILYEMLCKRRPFAGKNSDDLFSEITQREPKPLRQIDDTISVELENACLKCLAKTVAHRFATASDVAAALDSLSAAATLDKPVAKRIIWTPRHAYFVAAVAILLLITTFAIIIIRGDLAPSEWQDLLARDPMTLMGEPAVTLNEARTQLDIRSGHLIGAVSLGKADERPFAIRVNFAELKPDDPAYFGTGIFFGYHNSTTTDGTPCIKFQTIEIWRSRQDKFKIQRNANTVVTELNGRRRNFQHMLPIDAGVDIAPNTSLVVEFGPNGLKHVTLGRNELTDITHHEGDEIMFPEVKNYAGEYGVFVKRGSAAFNQVRFKHLEE